MNEPITDPVVLEQRRQAVMAWIAETVERVGWTTISVFAVAGSEVPFSYTIGLHQHGFPEFLIVGLSQQQAQPILGDLAERVLQKGERFHDGQELLDVFRGFRARLHAVPKPGRPLNMARNHYQGDVEALQVLWPDGENRLPGEEGCGILPGQQPLADGATPW
jgi:hypothetical protein